MQISARTTPNGRVQATEFGEVKAGIVLATESTLTRASAEHLGLEGGRATSTLINAGDVTVDVD